MMRPKTSRASLSPTKQIGKSGARLDRAGSGVLHLRDLAERIEERDLLGEDRHL